MQTLFSQTVSFNATRDDLTAPLPCSRGCVHSPDWLQPPASSGQARGHRFNNPPHQLDMMGVFGNPNSLVHVFIRMGDLCLYFPTCTVWTDMMAEADVLMPWSLVVRLDGKPAPKLNSLRKSCPNAIEKAKTQTRCGFLRPCLVTRLSTREGFPALQAWTQMFCINPATITPNPWKRDDIDMCVSYWVADKPPRQIWHCDPGHSATA